MKKKIFSKGLYLEGLRQLRMMGIITTVILTLLAVLIPAASGISLMIQEKQQVPDAGTVDSGYTYIPENELFADQEEVTREIISGPSANPFLFAIFLVVAPVMAVVLFSFLSKRRTSDFYHSIPHTRISIFLSFSASILSWIAIEILVSSACAALTYLIFSKYFELLFTDLLILMVSSFAASVLAVGAVSIAVSLTGIVGSNVLLSLAILFLPRILIHAISNTMLEQTPILARSGVFPLFADDYNLYTAIFLQIFNINFSPNTLTQPYFQLHGILYTLILGLVYLGLGLLLFVRRRSESAERSAPSRTLQTVYRTLFTCAFCLIPCVYFFMTVTDGYGGVDGDTVLSMVILYILALVIYFGYEILTTRKWKNLLRAIPGLAIVVAVNLAVIGGLFGIRAYHLSFSPDADEITGISVIPNDEQNYYRDLSFEDYVNSQMGEIVLDSDEVKEAVAKALSKNTSVLKDSMYRWRLFENSDPYYDDSSSDENSEKGQVLTFRIRTKFGSKVRSLKIAAKDANTINKLLSENEQFFKLWMTVPKPAGNSISYTDDYQGYYEEIPRDLIKEFTETLRQEVAGMDVQTWIDLVKNRYEKGYDVIATIDYPIRVGTSVDLYSIPISYRYMPKTTALLLKINSGDTEAQKKILDRIKDQQDGYSVSGPITFFRPDADNVLSSDDLYFSINEDPEIGESGEMSRALLALLLEKAECRPVEYGEPFVEVNFTWYRVSDDKYSYTTDVSYLGYIPLSSLTDEDLEKCGLYLTSGGGVFYD